MAANLPERYPSLEERRAKTRALLNEWPSLVVAGGEYLPKTVLAQMIDKRVAALEERPRPLSRLPPETPSM